MRQQFAGLSPHKQKARAGLGGRGTALFSPPFGDKRAPGTPENCPAAQGMVRKQAGQGLLCFACCSKQEVTQWERPKAETHPPFTLQHPQGPCPRERGTQTALEVGGEVCAPHPPAPMWARAAWCGARAEPRGCCAPTAPHPNTNQR